jgi:hypothetical protein
MGWCSVVRCNTCGVILPRSGKSLARRAGSNGMKSAEEVKMGGAWNASNMDAEPAPESTAAADEV